MTVRKIRTKQRTMRKTCFWCGASAVLRGHNWGRCACLDHERDLVAWDRKAQVEDHSDAAFYGRY